MSKTHAITAARVVGLVLGTIMVGYLSFTDGVWEPDNEFLVPDILMAVLLLAASSAPRRWAPPAMVFAFGWTAGILTVTVFDYLNRDEFAAPNLAMAVVAAAAAVVLTRAVTTEVRSPAGMR